MGRGDVKLYATSVALVVASGLLAAALGFVAFLAWALGVLTTTAIVTRHLRALERKVEAEAFDIALRDLLDHEESVRP